MGVPKFYRWISERYPCLSQVVKDYQIPEFDNFYLDMNGIIHSCSHPNDDDPFFRITEDRIFSDIFHYLEALFRIVKPHKVIFMAVDGVAPRAKMNQQRGRRFRSAKEAEEQAKKAIAKGLDLPSEARFDSNCITPGTPFMTRLNEQLKYFINQKLSTDPSWQKVEVIFSGHEVPGEGEHKVMDYIRYCKSQPNYNPNTRHCLYGLDADLIMLGLATHEPHFCLLREEIKFGKSNNKSKHLQSVDSITFHLLHLSIMREYLYYEFHSLKDKLPFPFNLESIIDDWILMGFLVGNDFIPHLPNMHIRQEILPYLYKIYKSVLPTLDGYINENGRLNMKRTEKYLEALAEYDREFFEDVIADTKWIEGKKNTKSSKNKGPGKEYSSSGIEDIRFDGFIDFGGGESSASSDTPTTTTTNSTAADEKLMRDLGIPDLESYFKDEDIDRKDQFAFDMSTHKGLYYRNKFQFTDVSEGPVHELAKCYIVGIQWILSYYYTGVPSWSWFYPYHYAPFVSDIKGISDLSIQFELGTPFLPFEQLLAVLPANSKSLLPSAYQTLMTSKESPVIDFYPTIFDHDLNGKQHEWEAVVLIPFIDEDRLIEAMKPLSVFLSEEEVTRNSHGPCLVYKYSKDYSPITYPSPWPTHFSDVLNCKVKGQVLSSNPYHVNASQLLFGLCPSVKLDVYFPGFPTLEHVPHKAFMDPRGVRVFQTASRGDSVCLKVLPTQLTQKTILEVAKELIGQTCFVRWPYLIEGKVWSVSDGQIIYFDDNERHGGGAKGRKLALTHHKMSPEDDKLFRDAVITTTKQHSTRYGIDLGPVPILVYVEELQGKRYVLDKTAHRGVMILEKQWSANPIPYPLQTVVKSITEHAPDYQEKVKTLEELYEVGSQCFILTPPYYGEQAEVVSVDSKHTKISIKFTINPEPNFDEVIGNSSHLNDQYSTISQIANRLELDPGLVARITSSIQCEKGSIENKKERERVNLGLNLKFSTRNQELVGYAKRMPRGGWLLSSAAENILKEYKQKFPVMFSYLMNHPNEDRYYESNLFPPQESSDSNETITAVKDWLKSLPIYTMTPMECGGDTLNTSHIASIETAVNALKNSPIVNKKTITHKYKPSEIYKPGDHQGGLIPDEHADFFLFDRVVNIASNGAIPFGLRGTLTGKYGNGMDNKTLYEIVFDEEFLGGLPLRCSGNRASRLPASCLLNISYGKRWENYSPTPQQRYHKINPPTTSLNNSGSYSSAAATSSKQSSSRNHGDRNNSSGSSYYIGGKPYKETSIGVRSMEERKESQHRNNKPNRSRSDPQPIPSSHNNKIILARKKDPSTTSTTATNTTSTGSTASTDSTAKVSEFDLMMSAMSPNKPTLSHSPKSIGHSPKLITPQEMTLPPSRSLTAPPIVDRVTTPSKLTTPLQVTSPNISKQILTPKQLTTPQSKTTPITQPILLTPQHMTTPIQTMATPQKTSLSQSLFTSPNPKTTPTSNIISTMPTQMSTNNEGIDVIAKLTSLSLSSDNNNTRLLQPTTTPISATPITASNSVDNSNSNKGKFTPSVAAIFEHHKQQKEDIKDDEKGQPLSSSGSEFKQEEEKLKSLLGIPIQANKIPNIYQPRGPMQQPRGPVSSPISQPRGPMLYQTTDYVMRSGGVANPRGILFPLNGPLPRPPQIRGPVNSVNSQSRGPIMSTGYHHRQPNHSSGQPLLPMPPYYSGGYSHYYPPPPPPYANSPYTPWHPASHYYYPPHNTHNPPRGPSSRNFTGPLPPPVSSLNPMSLPFTPLQVQIKHGSKVVPPSTNIPEKENIVTTATITPSLPSQTPSAAAVPVVVGDITTQQMSNDSESFHNNNNWMNDMIDVNQDDEMVVEAIQSSSVDDTPHVVGDIVMLKQ